MCLKCKNLIESLINEYKNCEVCGKPHIHKRFCSKECRVSMNSTFFESANEKRRLGIMVSGRKGKTNSTESNSKRSRTLIEFWNSEESNAAREKTRNGSIHRWESPEEKEKLRQRMIGNKFSLGHKHDAIALNKISQRSKELWQQEDFIAMQRERRKNYWENEETHENASKKLKLAYLEGRRTVAKGTGHGKGQYHFCRLEDKNVWLRSSYEVRFATWLDKNNIEWLYEPVRFPLNELHTSYAPDFYLPRTDEWFEIKGYFTKTAKEKYKYFLRNYSYIQIKLIFSDDLTKIEKSDAIPVYP